MFSSVIALDVILRGVVLSAVGLAWAIFAVRVVGLRAFSKMTSFDFIVTVAAGSLLAGASQATGWAGFFQPLIALGALLGVQAGLAHARRRWPSVMGLLQNEPVLLMQDGKLNKAALAKTRVAQSDVIAKLREANVLDYSQVRAVVLETTGDISVLHGDTLDPNLIDGVRRFD